MTIPAFGENGLFNSTNIFLQDVLSGMGDYFTKDVGTLNWIEAKVQAQLCETAFNFLQLWANQIQPSSSSILLDDWANIYNIQSLSVVENIKYTIEIIQSLTGTPPTLSNVTFLLQRVLGNIFIECQWVPENQYLATTDPYQDLIINKQQYQMPLAKLVIYVWQPRDNQDNLLLPTNVFNNLVNSYVPLLERWLPHFTELITLNLVNRGNQDGYAGGYHGFNYNNYVDVHNVVSGTAGSNIISGNNTTFTKDFFPQNAHTTSPFSIGRTPPLQVVDDTNQLQTYYVLSVNSDTSITLTSPIINNITNRTYRTLGIVFDTDGMLDGASLLNK